MPLQKQLYRYVSGLPCKHCALSDKVCHDTASYYHTNLCDSNQGRYYMHGDTVSIHDSQMVIV